jgi:hypothetical protein
MIDKLDRRKNRIVTDEQVVRRILAKCKKSPTGCLEWQGYLDPNGYGQTSYKKKMTSVHRVIYMAHHGVTLTKREHVCHKCDNPKCCNVDHHFVGSAKVNMRDMFSKGRDARTKGNQNLPVGQRAHLAKITDAQEFEIRALLAAGMGPTAIYRTGRFPITIAAISKIKHGHSRKHNYPTK